MHLYWLLLKLSNFVQCPSGKRIGYQRFIFHNLKVQIQLKNFEILLQKYSHIIYSEMTFSFGRYNLNRRGKPIKTNDDKLYFGNYRRKYYCSKQLGNAMLIYKNVMFIALFTLFCYK